MIGLVAGNTFSFEYETGYDISERSTLRNCWIAQENGQKKRFFNTRYKVFFSSLMNFMTTPSTMQYFHFQRLHFDDYEEFVPIIDGVGGILPEPPEQLTLHRRKTPIVIGTTKDESSLRICKLVSFFSQNSLIFSTSK